jgi:hypothetical protein
LAADALHLVTFAKVLSEKEKYYLISRAILKLTMLQHPNHPLVQHLRFFLGDGIA